MATPVTLSNDGVSCHAWNKDASLLAISPNNNEIHIFETKTWKRLHLLQEHDLQVSGIDWSHTTNKIVSCSHDRNAFVWTLQSLPEGESWKPTLVILRIEKAAISARWSTDGLLFAVESGAKCVPVCTYNEKNDWWICKMIKKKHKSTVLCIAFHPTNGQLLATGCADFKCRVHSTYSADVDGDRIEDVNAGVFGTPVEFGDNYCELTSMGWIHAVAWSPSGDVLVYAGHDSTIHFATLKAAPAEPVVQTILLNGLPMNSLLFVSDKALIAGGHDMNPAVFTKKSSGWSFLSHVDKQKENSDGQKTSGIASARELFQNKTQRGQTSKNDSLLTKHDRPITEARMVAPPSRISTSGLDGRVVVWDLPSLDIDMSTLGL